MNPFIDGATMMACVAIGLFFLKFWRNTRDRLFFMFALSFWLLALDRMLVAVVGEPESSTAAEYLLRLAAFVLIIGAIVEKNRK